MKIPLVVSSRPAFLAAMLILLSLSPLGHARMMDNGVDPANLGKGEHIYQLDNAIAGMNGNVPSVNSFATMMTYLKSQGVEHIIVKAGSGSTNFPPGGNQFTTALVDEAHAKGIKIFGYTRSHGVDIPGEIDIAALCFNRGADGFVIDAEIEWETRNLPDNFNKALQLGAGIKALFPNKFLAHAPFVYIDNAHESFPYKEFGLYCDAVMPQAYWNKINQVNCSPTQMAADLSTEWRNWQNSLSGIWTNAIKPICPIGSAWQSEPECIVTSAKIIEFVNALKSDPNPATKGGYHGVNYWVCELQTPDMWDGVRNADIGTKPVILVQPKSLTVTNLNPTNVTISVEAAGGNPLYYQWRFNGIGIPGATNWNYTISNVQFTNGGAYSVVITNYLGTSNSANATLTVKAKPQVTTQPASQIIVVSNNVSFNVTANGTTPLSYQWKLNGANIGSATNSAYTRTNVPFAAAGNYTAVISNPFGVSTSAVANLTVVSSSTPPIITAQPQGKTVIAGSTASLAVSASGTSPLTYQWRTNGVNIPGATGSVLNFTNIQSASAGIYSVIVSNSAGIDTSMNVSLAVHYALNLSITGDGTVTKNPNAAGYPSGTAVTLTAGSGFTGWAGDASGSVNPMNVTMNGNKNITANFNSVDIAVDNTSATIAGSWSTGTSATPWNGDYRHKGQGTGAAYLQFTPNLPYAGSYQVWSWHVAGGNRTTAAPHIVNYNGGSQTITVNQETGDSQWNLLGNFNFFAGSAGYVRITDTIPEPTGNVVMADGVRWVYLPLPLITTQPQSQTNITGGSATFTVEASRATGYQWKFGANNISGATTSSYTRSNLQTNDAGNYSVVVSGGNGSVTSANAALTVHALPSISISPQSQTVNQGANALFSVTASGTSVLTYQWRFIGVDIPGATNSNYARNNAQPSDTGDYSVVVRNNFGAAISAGATLTIPTPPVITTHPVDQAVNPGGSVTFNVAATGVGAMTCQWQFNGTNLLNATNFSYIVTGANQSKSGFYVAIVSNVTGSTPSDPAFLTVNTPPSIVTHPQDQSVFTGSTVTFSVVAGGTPPFFYRWYYNNAFITGATNSSFTRPSAQPAHAGNYFADVFNALGQATTVTATLAVNPQPTEFASPSILPDKTIQLIFTSQPGGTNIVEGSIDLVIWLPLVTNVNTNGTSQFIDGATNLPFRFYRSRAP